MALKIPYLNNACFKPGVLYSNTVTLWNKKEKTGQIWFVFLMDTCKGCERLCYKRTERNEIVVNGAVFEQKGIFLKIQIACIRNNILSTKSSFITEIF